MSNSNFSPETAFQEALAAHQAGQPQEALLLLQQALAHVPDNDVILTALGGVYLSIGDYAQAFPALERAVQINPANIDARVNLGIALQGSGQIPQGLQQFEEALRLAPDRTDIRYNLANLLLQTQAYPAAIEQLRKLNTLAPTFLPAYHTLGAVYSYLQQYDNAQQAYEEALKAVPNDLQTMLLLGNLLVDIGHTEAAAEAYQKTVEAHPTHFLPHAALGKFLVDIGRLEEGQTALRQAFELEPNDLNTNILLGNVYKDLGNIDEAEQFYRKATQIDPQHQGAQMNLRRLLSAKIPFWHFEMLADTHRNDAYEEALKKAVRPTSLVLDIGTGSGLLSMMAARAGAQQVVACEMHERLAKTAQEIVALNGYGDTISVHHKKSTLLQVGEELAQRADVVVSEILDVGGLGEGVLPSIRHAVQQLAKPDASLIPARIQLWGQLIEIPARSKVAPVQKISGFDLSPFEKYRVPNEYLKVVLKAEKYKTLSPVVPLLGVDFYNLPPAYPDDQPRQIPLQIPIETEGMLQAIVFWFDLYLDDDIKVSSQPNGELEHWGQALFCFPNPRSVSSGDEVPVVLLQSDQIIRFVLGTARK